MSEPTSTAITFQVGDRVAERPRNAMGPIGNGNPACNVSRRGHVVGSERRTNARGTPCLYVSVIWDGRRSPSLHAGHRLINLETR